MKLPYKAITAGTSAKVADGYLYVMQTNMRDGMLEQGGYADRVYRMPYTGTLDDAQVPNEWGITDLNRCLETGKIVRKGRLIR